MKTLDNTATTADTDLDADTEEAKTPGLVVLDEPIKRGETTIDTLTVRKPKPGELHGLSLTALLNLEVNVLREALPRMTVPPLTKAEVGRMDPADFLQAGTELVAFLLPKAAKASATA